MEKFLRIFLVTCIWSLNFLTYFLVIYIFVLLFTSVCA